MGEGRFSWPGRASRTRLTHQGLRFEVLDAFDVRDARDLGCRTGVLGASPMGLPLCRQIGLREDGAGRGRRASEQCARVPCVRGPLSLTGQAGMGAW